jgi:serine/threonine protein kinase
MSAPAASSPVQPGEVIADRYRVERVIGVGGMGIVLAARHLQLDHLVAIKLLLPEVVDNTEAVSRFLREARAAVRIQNEHVARVTDVGTLPTGAPYMVMEYLEGTDLAALVRSNGPLPIEDAVDFLLQACEAVAEAHSLGIVHRDLKPGNLFLVRRADGSRVVKVLDFGISKTTGIGGAGAPMTNTAVMMGTPLYMSPEQLSSARDVDARADIWSLGIILFELLTGRLPFAGDTIPQLCVAIMHAPPTRMSSLRPDVPAGLDAIVARCVEKTRQLRYGSVADFSRALLEFAPARSGVSVERVTHILEHSQKVSPVLPTAPGSASTAGVRQETVLVPEDFSGLTPAPAVRTDPAWGRTSPAKKRTARRNVTLALVATGVIGVVLAAAALLRPASPVTSASPGTLPSTSASSPLASPDPVETPPPTTAEVTEVPPAPTAPAPVLSTSPQPPGPRFPKGPRPAARPPATRTQPLNKALPGSGLD